MPIKNPPAAAAVPATPIPHAAQALLARAAGEKRGAADEHGGVRGRAARAVALGPRHGVRAHRAAQHQQHGVRLVALRVQLAVLGDLNAGAARLQVCHVAHEHRGGQAAARARELVQM